MKQWVVTLAYKWVCLDCDREVLTADRNVPRRCLCGSYAWKLVKEPAK